MNENYFDQPLSWTRLKKWLDGKTTEPRETAQQALGRVVHARLLQPVEYLQRRAIFDAPINPKTGVEYGADTKAVQSARAEFMSTLRDDAIVLTSANAARVERIASAVAESGFCVGENDRVETHVERVVEVNGVDVALHGYIDLHSVGAVDGYTFANVVEVKTTGKPIAAFSGRDKFYWEALELGYLHQLAYYSILLDHDVTNASFLVVETAEPFRVATVNVKYSTLNRCKKDILEVFLPAWLDQRRPDLILEC
jgi:hypothetical protein